MELSEATIEDIVIELRSRPMRFALVFIEQTDGEGVDGVAFSDEPARAAHLLYKASEYVTAHYFPDSGE